MPNELEFIRQHVKVWPEGAICFFTTNDDQSRDFFVEGFDRAHIDGCVMTLFDREEWECGGWQPASAGDRFKDFEESFLTGIARELGVPESMLKMDPSPLRPTCLLYKELHCPNRCGTHCNSTKPCINREDEPCKARN